MKIIYIGARYDYGKPEQGFSYGYYNFYNSLINMNKGKNEVIFFPFDEIIRKIGREEMNKRLLETVETEKPDLCFFFLSSDEIKKETVKQITDSGKTITFNWFADDKWRFHNFTKYWASLFNWVSTDQKSALKEYDKIGYKNVIVGCWGCNHFLYKPLNLPEIYDVTFVGQLYGKRGKIVEQIKKAGIKIECWGKGWPNGKISQERMIKIFSQSKINLNFTERCEFGLKSIIRIFLSRKNDKSIQANNPRYWIDNLKSLWSERQNEIKGRNFEIPGCNGFLITGDADNLRDYYEDGKEIVIYKNTKDLIDKIKYYLEHNEEREVIAKAGYERTLWDYTYEKRFNEIFNFIRG